MGKKLPTNLNWWTQDFWTINLNRTNRDTPLKTNMSPKKGTISVYIWTNHWFSGDIRIFSGDIRSSRYADAKVFTPCQGVPAFWGHRSLSRCRITPPSHRPFSQKKLGRSGWGSGFHRPLVGFKLCSMYGYIYLHSLSIQTRPENAFGPQEEFGCLGICLKFMGSYIKLYIYCIYVGKIFQSHSVHLWIHHHAFPWNPFPLGPFPIMEISEANPPNVTPPTPRNSRPY